MVKKVAVLAGDGIGPEVVTQAVRVLTAVTEATNKPIELLYGDIGGAAYDKYGVHFPEETKNVCRQADAILFGSVGGPVSEADSPKWQGCEANSILALRKMFQLSTNFRPIHVHSALAAICPLKIDINTHPINILIVRELVGGIYFGEHKRFLKNQLRCAMDVSEYSEEQIVAVAHYAFRAARRRSKKLTSVDKANVLQTSKLWREVIIEVSSEYPSVKLEHMLVDNCAMQLISNPGQFDVIVTANLFGDILSDAASAIPGGLGLTPSASLNNSGFGLYEPSGGSATDIAGQNIANPIAQILSAAMMLRYSLNRENEGKAIEQAVSKVLQSGLCTKDIYTEGKTLVNTTEITDAIIKQL